MNFQAQLKRKREAFEADTPPEVLSIMHKATKELKESGIKDNVIKVGEVITDFELYDQNNNVVSSKVLLKKGPLVITFYRGYW